MGERVSGAVKQDSSQLTPTPVGTTDVTSSQEGSLSVPQPGLSPMLAQYKSYLQSCYKARTLAPADKYLPTLQVPYINLAMIKRGYHGRDARDEFTRRTLHGGVDQILASKTPINIEDLLVPECRHSAIRKALLLFLYTSFDLSGVEYETKYPVLGDDRFSDSDESFESYDTGPLHNVPLMSGASKMVETNQRSDMDKKEPVRFILVEGPPGIGKSTFAWEVCRRWDEIESLRNYHTVVLLKLREKWVLNATQLSDLFRYPFQPELSQTIAQELHDSNGRNLLWF